MFVMIDTEHAFRPAALHLNGIEPGVAPDIQNRHAGQIFGNRVLEISPFGGRIVAQEVIRRGLHAPQEKDCETMDLVQLLFFQFHLR